MIRNVILDTMPDPVPHDPSPTDPHNLPGRGRGAAPAADGPEPQQRPSFAQRMQPWVDLVYKLLAAAFLAMMLWRGLG
jgi:hypothetical protein